MSLVLHKLVVEKLLLFFGQWLYISWINLHLKKVLPDKKRKKNYINLELDPKKSSIQLVKKHDEIILPQEKLHNWYLFIIGDGPIGLILAPTRELSQQIYVETKKFCRAYGINAVCCYGGGSKWEQSKDLEQGAEIIVATPGTYLQFKPC